MIDWNLTLSELKIKYNCYIWHLVQLDFTFLSIKHIFNLNNTLKMCDFFYTVLETKEILTVFQLFWILVLILLLNRYLILTVFLKLSLHLFYSPDNCKLGPSPWFCIILFLLWNMWWKLFSLESHFQLVSKNVLHSQGNY